MGERLKVSLLARSIAILLCAIALGVSSAPALAQEASATPSGTPGALKPIVLIAGGTGYVKQAAGQGPEVLNSAEIYDPALHQFLPIAAMNEQRDQFAAAAIAKDKVLIVGGINTLLTETFGPGMIRQIDTVPPWRNNIVVLVRRS